MESSSPQQCKIKAESASQDWKKMQTHIKSRKSLMRKACPRCGGDVCRMRDTFGVYHQCAQCGREFRRQPSVTIPQTTITAPANHTDQKEPAMV